MTSTTTVLRLNDVSKHFVIRKDKSMKDRLLHPRRSLAHKEDFWAVRDVEFEISIGETVGLVGPNGSGKSTLLKMMGGVLQPTKGTVERRGRLAALIEIGAGFHPDLTGRENVHLNCSILGLSQEQTNRWFDSIVAFSGIERFIDTQVKFYSSGMYVRLAFAVAIHVDPDILLVDEVLAVGDEPFQRKCLNQIQRFQSEGRTVVLVTHALEHVQKLCDRAVVLEAGSVVADGRPRDALHILRSDYEDARQAQLAADEQAREAEATVEALRVTRDGEVIESVEPGDDVVVEIDIAARVPLEDWVLGIGLDTPLGQVVFGTNSRLLGVRMPDLAPGTTQTFRLALPNLHLGEGEYFVHGSVARSSGEGLHRLPQGAMIWVKGQSESIGVLHSSARILP